MHHHSPVVLQQVIYATAHIRYVVGDVIVGSVGSTCAYLLCV